jgi:hypothetical protein
MQREDYVTYYTGEFAAHAPDEILLVPMDSIASAESTGPDDYMFNRIGGLERGRTLQWPDYTLWPARSSRTLTRRNFGRRPIATGDVKEIEIDGAAYTGKIVNTVALAESLGA